MRVLFIAIAVGFGLLVIWDKIHPHHFYTDAPFELTGSWDTGCRLKEDTPRSSPVPSRIQVSFKGSRQEEFYILYADPQCNIPTAFSRSIANARFELAADLGPHAYRLNSNYANFYWTQLIAQAVDSSNAKMLYGFGDWAAQVEKEVTDRAVAPGLPVREAQGTKIYDIIRRDGETISFGAQASGDRTEGATRPTRFEEAAQRYSRMSEDASGAAIINQNVEAMKALGAQQAKQAEEAAAKQATGRNSTSVIATERGASSSRWLASKASSEYRCTCTCWYREKAGDSIVCENDSGSRGRHGCKAAKKSLTTESREKCINAPFLAGRSCPESEMGTVFRTGERVYGMWVCQ